LRRFSADDARLVGTATVIEALFGRRFHRDHLMSVGSSA